MRHGNLALGVVAVVVFSVAGWVIGSGSSGLATTQTRLPVVAGEVAYAIPQLRTAERSAPAAIATPPTLPSAAVGGAAPTPTTTPTTTLPAADEVAVQPVPGRPSYLEPTPFTPADVAAIDADFLVALNELRADAGASELRRDESLDELAASWTETMTAADALQHSEMIYDLVAEDWLAAGENIAFGPAPSGIMEGFDESPEHRANMVNPDYDRLGVGTIVVDGVIWTTHLFAG